MRILLIAALSVTLLMSTVAEVAAAPGLVVDAPQDGATIQGSTVTVRFHVSDFNIVPTNIPLSEAGKHPEVNRPGQGHVHFTLDAQPLVLWYQDSPYTFQNVPPGRHQLMVELVNNDHSSLSPQVMTMIVFNVVPAPGSAAPSSVMPDTGRPATGTVAWLSGSAALICFAAGLRLRRPSRRRG